MKKPSKVETSFIHFSRVLSLSTFGILVIILGFSFFFFTRNQLQSSNIHLTEQILLVTESVTNDISGFTLLQARNALIEARLFLDSGLASSVIGTRVSQRFSDNLTRISSITEHAVVIHLDVTGQQFHTPREIFPSWLRNDDLWSPLESVFIEAIAKQGAAVWSSAKTNRGIEPILVRSIIDPNTLTLQGVYGVKINVQELLSRITQQEQESLVRVYWNDTLIAENQSFNQGSVWFSHKAFSSLTDWSVQRTLKQEIAITTLTTPILISFFSWILLVILLQIGTKFTTTTIAQSIDNLLSEIQLIENGILGRTLPVEGNDQITNLTEAFNKMSKKLESMLKALAEEEIHSKEEHLQATKAQLAALQLQISPHFLFNILESINSLAIVKNEKEISQIVIKLGRVLRQLLHDDSPVVSLNEEIMLTKDIVSLYELTIGKPIEMVYNFEEKLSSYQVPRLILQPIIENSIVHGFSHGTENPIIHISISETTDGSLILMVEDNGIPKEIRKEFDQNIGLSNVEKRLILRENSKSWVRAYQKADSDGFIVEIKISKT